MKQFPPFLVVLLAMASLSAQEPGSPKWNVEIPAPLVQELPAEPAPEPQPVAFSIEESRTTRMEVTESPEMPDLPPVQGTINVTVQKVADPNLPDPPPPLPALPPDDPAVQARLEELRETYRGTDLVFLSATTYDGRRTLLRIYPNGGTEKEVVAWSNVDFMHFTGQAGYRIKHPDGTVQDIGLLMGVGSVDTGRAQALREQHGGEYEAPEIPEMTDLAAGGPAFVVVDGNSDSPAMATLEQLHDLYRKEGVRMEADYRAREQARAERKAYLLANPPKPEDVTIQFWKRGTPAAPQTSQP